MNGIAGNETRQQMAAKLPLIWYKLDLYRTNMLPIYPIASMCCHLSIESNLNFFLANEWTCPIYTITDCIILTFPSEKLIDYYKPALLCVSHLWH